MGNKKNITE